MDIIYGHYKDSLNALPVEDKPSLAPRLLDAGVCFGFADPVTNIIANTLSFREPEPNGATKKRKRKRKLKKDPLSEARSREEVSPRSSPATALLCRRRGLLRSAPSRASSAS